MNNTSFEPEVEGYALETLINGNISHCKSYLNQLKDEGYLRLWHDELTSIKEGCPERYEYMLEGDMGKLKYFKHY